MPGVSHAGNALPNRIMNQEAAAQKAPWQEQALAHWELINQMAARRFPQDSLAEEAALYVMDRLARDNWRRLRSFQATSSLRTYIRAITYRLLEDFSRQRFGRLKPPAWIKQLGGIWLSLFQLLCQERYTPAEAVAILTSRQGAAEKQVEHCAYQLLGELPDCGKKVGEQTAFQEEQMGPSGQPSAGSWQQEQLETKEREQFFAVLSRLLLEGETQHSMALLTKGPTLNFALSTQERLLLQLCYRDGIAVAQAGRMLGWNRHQTHGRLRRLLKKIEQTLERAGLAQELRQLL